MKTRSGTPRIVSLADIEPQDVKWLWPGRIPSADSQSSMAIRARSKTTLMIDIAARVTRGDKMPDGSVSDFVRPRGVVILTAEDGLEDTVRPRLDAAGADVTKVVSLSGIASGEDRERLPTIDDIEAIAEAIAEVDAALVIFDPLVAYLGDGTDANRDAAVRSGLAPLFRLAEDRGVAVVGIRHLNKKGDVTKALYRGGGSIGLAGAARSVLLAGVDPDDDQRRAIASVKCNLAPTPPALGYRIVETLSGAICVEWLGEASYGADELLGGTTGPSTSKRDRAVRWLGDELRDGPRTANQVKERAAEAGHTHRTLRRASDELGVQKSPSGFGDVWIWSLPNEDGREEDAHPSEERDLAISVASDAETPSGKPLPAELATPGPLGQLRDVSESATDVTNGQLWKDQGTAPLLSPSAREGGQLSSPDHASGSLEDARWLFGLSPSSDQTYGGGGVQ